MNLQRSQERIIELFAKFVAEVKGATAMNKTDINRLSQSVMIPLFAEICGFRHLRNLDFIDERNYPAIDLADEVARVAIQVTATPHAEKIKSTLRQFVNHDLHLRYDRLIVYILTEKQRSYSGRGYTDILHHHFHFDPDQDVWDYRDLLRTIAGFDLERTEQVREILELHFGTIDGAERIVRAAETHFGLGNFEVALDLYTELLATTPCAEYFIGRGKCRLQLAYDADRKRNSLDARWSNTSKLRALTGAQDKETRDHLSNLMLELEKQAFKDFSDAIAVASSTQVNALARKQRLHMQAHPFYHRCEWEGDINWLKQHLDENEWGEVMYLEALSYGFDSYLFREDTCQEVADCAAMAVSCLDRAIQLGYDVPEVYLLRAQAHHGSSNFGLALLDLDRVIEGNSQDLLPEAWSIRANILMKMHRFDEALETYETFRKRFGCLPSYVDALMGIEDALLCGIALQHAYGPIDSDLAVRLSPGTISATLAWDERGKVDHPKTYKLLKSLM